jgi:hypothetical protein
MVDTSSWRVGAILSLLVCFLAIVAPAPGATPGGRPQAPDAAGRKRVKLHGKVTDFDGKPLAKAQIRVLGRGFARDVAGAVADENGRYEMEVEEGTYLAVWICKDYKEKMLEYWAWHVPIYGDLELSARVDGLEVYGTNAFWPRYRQVLMVYFRPMSLKRYHVFLQGKRDAPGAIAIVPNLAPHDIHVTIDGKPVPVLGVNKVREQVPSEQYMEAYLVQVQADGIDETDAYRKITVAITDRETGEQGEGSVFWRNTRYEEGEESGGKE